MAKKKRRLFPTAANKDTRHDESGQTSGSGETPYEVDDEEEEVKAWHETISKTMQWRDGIAQRNRWEVLIKEYKGDWKHLEQNLSIDLIPVQLIYAYVKTEIARLYFRDPWITVNPKKMEDLGGSRIAEALINYKWSELNLKHEFKKAILDALLTGHGWIKVGYSAEFGTAESKDEEAETTGKATEVMANEFIKSENVFAYHTSWRDVLFSPDSLEPPHDSRWVAFRVVKPLKAVKESKIYENTEDLKPSGPKKPEEQSEARRQIETVTLWEIWDIDHMKVKTIAEGHEEFLRVIDWPYDIKGFPCVRVSFNISDEPYPMSEVAMGEPQVIEIMKMVAIMINHLKRWNRQIFLKEGFMTELEEAKFVRGNDGALIKYQGDAGKDIFIPPYAPVQQDIYGVYSLTTELFRTVMGQTEMERSGKASTTTRTKFELQQQMQGARGRSDEKLDMLEDQISEVARKLIGIMREKMKIPQIIRTVGQRVIQDAIVKSRKSANMPNSYAQTIPGQQSFSVMGVDIPDELDIDTVAGSTMPLNKENKLDLLIEFLKIGEKFGIAPGTQASREIGREILREIDVKEMERIMDVADQEAAKMAQQPNPEMQKTQMEMQLKMMDAQARMKQEQIRTQSSTIQAQSQMAQAQIQKDIAQLKMQQEIMKHILQQRKTEQEIMNGQMPVMPE